MESSYQTILTPTDLLPKSSITLLFKQRWNFEKATGKYYTHFPQKLYQTILLSLSLRYELVLNLYELRYVQRVPLEQFLISKSSSKNRPFHVKWTKAGHNYLRFWWKFLKGRYEIRLSWKFQHKLITCSKMITPQSWLDNLKIDRIRGGVMQHGCIFKSQYLFFYLTKSSEICCTASMPRGL